jgi:hypothetical protein
MLRVVRRRCLLFCALVLLGTLGGLAAAPVTASLNTIEPNLISTIDINAAGGGSRLLLGDVSGDGRLDIVMVQPGYTTDDRFRNNYVQALTAYSVSGTLQSAPQSESREFTRRIETSAEWHG